ncbi:MAG: hypothetical protein ACREVO_13270 [Steroidobacteraceae bacterium]
MTPSDYAAIAADAIALLSTVVGIVAAVAACRSATSARDATALMRQQQRDALVRDVNVLANRVAVTATHVDKLAKALEAAEIATNWDGYDAAAREIVEQRAIEQCARAKQVSDDAVRVLMTGFGVRSDAELSAVLLSMEGRLVQLDGMKEDICRKLDGISAERKERRQSEAAHREAVAAAGGRVAPSAEELERAKRGSQPKG